MEPIGDVRQGCTGNVFGSGVFEVHTWREVEADFAENELHKGRAVHGAFARKEVLARPQPGIAQSEQCAGQFAKGIAGAVGGDVDCFAKQILDLIGRQTEIQHGECGIEFLIEILGNPVFLNTELDMLSMDLQVGFDDPVVAIDALALEQEGVGPGTPGFVAVQVALSTADGFVDQGEAAAKADAAGLGVAFQEFLVGEPG